MAHRNFSGWHLGLSLGRDMKVFCQFNRRAVCPGAAACLCGNPIQDELRHMGDHECNDTPDDACT